MGKIGYIYVEQARQRLGGLSSVGANITENLNNTRRKAKLVKSMFKTYKDAKKMDIPEQNFE